MVYSDSDILPFFSSFLFSSLFWRLRAIIRLREQQARCPTSFVAFWSFGGNGELRMRKGEKGEKKEKREKKKNVTFSEVLIFPHLARFDLCSLRRSIFKLCWLFPQLALSQNSCFPGGLWRWLVIFPFALAVFSSSSSPHSAAFHFVSGGIGERGKKTERRETCALNYYISHFLKFLTSGWIPSRQWEADSKGRGAEDERYGKSTPLAR